MQNVFKNALYHREPTVLQRRLLPLSLAHVYSLMVIDSPYVTGGEKTLLDLAIAVMICSRTWKQGQAFFESDDILDQCAKWGRKCRRLDFNTEQSNFVLYLDEYTQFPDRYSTVKPEAQKPCKHPWPLLIAKRLIGPSCNPETEARVWDMPLPLALSYWSAEAEIQGDESLATEADKQKRVEQEAHREKQRLEYEANQKKASE